MPVRAARRHFDGGTSVVPQAALHRFLADGHFASHLRAMRSLYAAKRSAILASIRDAFAGFATAEAGEAGMHVLLRLPPDCPDHALAGRADLATVEKEEIDILNEFLPKGLTDEEVDAAIRAAITASGAEGPKDMGKVIAHLKAEYPGRIDFGKASGKVRAALAEASGQA